MSTKPKKPPIDKKAVRARLQFAQENQLRVRVRRWIPKADRLDGFVVGVGTTWLAMQPLSDRVTFDGWRLARLKDVQAVSIDPDPDRFEIKALKARGLWPPTVPDVTLDDVVGALETAAAAAPLVTVHDEFDRPDVCWVGAVQSVAPRALRLLKVGPSGDWHRRVSTFDPEDITRIEFGGGYEEALHLVAGPPPSV